MILILTLFIQLAKVNSQSIAYFFQAKIPETAEIWLYYSFISTDQLCLGTPSQCLTVQFDPGTSLLVILDFNKNTINPCDTIYNNANSTTFRKISGQETYSNQKMITGHISKDVLTFKYLNETSSFFYLANSWNSDLPYSSVGVSAINQDATDPNLMDKLINQDLIRSYQNTIFFNNNTHDRIVFGEDNNMKNLIKKFSIKGNKVKISLYFSIQKLFMINRNDNEQIEMNHDKIMETMFDETFRFIQMPFVHNSTIYNKVLNDTYCRHDKHCPQKRYLKDECVIYYICNKAIIQTETIDNDIVIMLNETNITILKEDMWEEYDKDNVLFMIIFKKHDPQLWIIGHPFLKHYIINRNLENNTYTFYSFNVNDYSLQFTLFITVLAILLIGLCYNGYVYYQLMNKH